MTRPLRSLAHPRRAPSWQALTAIGVAAVLIASAFVADGARSAKVALDDGGVWVTSTTRELAGRVNTQIRDVDMTSEASNASDVVQNGRTVLLVRPGQDVRVVNPATGTTARSSSASGVEPLDDRGRSPYAFGGSMLAVTVGDQGDAYVVAADAIGSTRIGSGRKAARLGADADVAVGPTGTAFGLSRARREVVSLTAGPGITKLAIDGAATQFAVDGTTPVVWGAARTQLQVGDGVVDLHGQVEGATSLQQSGGDAGVVLADGHGLVRVEDGHVTRLVSFQGPSRTPVRPVSVAGCAYGAWTGGGRPLLAIACAGQRPFSQSLSKDDAELRFRVNGSRVVLNDLGDGTAYLPDRTHVVEVPFRNKSQSTDQDPNKQNPVDAEDGEHADCIRGSAEAPPQANADTGFRARPNVATVLTVLANDTDANCDLLTITDVTPIDGSVASVTISDSGETLQFLATPSFQSPITFRYTVSDGLRPSTATVTVSPVRAEDDAAPTADATSVTVVAGRTATTNVAAGFHDTDGDVVTITAVTPYARGSVRVRSDGAVTVEDRGTGNADTTLDVIGSDPYGKTATMKLRVLAIEKAPPVARADRAVGVVGEDAVIRVLANDADPAGYRMRLSGVDAAGSDRFTARIDENTDTVVFHALQEGLFTFHYTVVSPGGSAQGTVSVDVRARDRNHPPRTSRDVLRVRPGGSGIVDVLANDTDPDLDVLVVTSATGPPGTAVTVLDHRLLKVTLAPDVQITTGTLAVQYEVSDGALTATGQLLVVVLPSGDANRPPEPQDDFATVRTGRIVDVPVLDNDSDPDGDPLTLASDIVVNATDGQRAGFAFVSGRKVRFAAGTKPGEVELAYSVADPSGARTSAVVHVTIVGGETANRPPAPRDLDARTIAGNTVDIPVPTSSIDPDGDVVGITLASAPLQGRLVRLDDLDRCSCFHFEAARDSAGTATFRYRATDPGQLSNLATIRVGIAARPGINAAPVTAPDTAVIRPGGRAVVAVLANDFDPEGDPISLAARQPGLASTGGIDVKIVGAGIAVSATHAGTSTFVYVVTDAFGATGQGSLTVRVTPDAPPVPPIARDDRAVVENGAKTVSVPVVRNDEDPDGDVARLRVRLPMGGGSVDGQHVVVAPGAATRLVPYTVTDPDGASATAVVTVPSRRSGNRPPELRRDSVTVHAGRSNELRLGDLVTDPDGDPVRLTSGASVVTSGALGRATDKDTIAVTPAADASGPGSLSFEVTDGRDGSAGHTVVLVVGLDIVGGNAPPQFVGTQVQVQRGGQTHFDLRRAARDPDGDRITFRGARSPSKDVTVDIDGTDLVVHAADTAPAPSTQAVAVTADDGHHHEVTGFVVVSVVKDQAPPVVAALDVAEAHRGVPVTIPVLANDYAPSGRTLKVVGVIGDARWGQLSNDATRVTFTADPHLPTGGTIELRYKVTDRPADPDREQIGIVRLSIKDKPTAPTEVRVTGVGNGYVDLAWSPPDSDGGTPIDLYKVTATGGASTPCGIQTTCRVTGLHNGSTYTFAVTAHNEVGWGPTSSPPVAGTPDELPAAPAPPTLTFVKGSTGPGELNVEWKAPVNVGSDIYQYEVQVIGPGAPAPRLLGGDQRFLKVQNLQNGQRYTATVRARNHAAVDNGWGAVSGESAPESPAAPPTAPRSVTLSRIQDSVGGRLHVQWIPPAAINAEALTAYTVQLSKGGAPQAPVTITQDLASAAPFYDFQNLQPDAQYTATVRAENKAAESPPSTSPNSVTPYAVPGAVTAINARGDGENGTALLQMSDPPANGDPITSYQVDVMQGQSSTQVAGTRQGGDVVVRNLTNGTQYSFRVRACNQAGCSQSPGNTSNPTTPFGPPGAPSGGAVPRSATSATFYWDPPGSINGANAGNVHLSVVVDGQDLGPKGLSHGTRDVSGGYSQTHTMTLTTVTQQDGVEVTSGPITIRWTADAPPPPSVDASPGERHTIPGQCISTLCTYVVVRTTNISPPYHVACYTQGQSAPFAQYTTSSNPSTGGCVWGYWGGRSGQWLVVNVNGVWSPRK